LLSPNTASSSENPCGPSTAIVLSAADDGRIAIGGERDGEPLERIACCARPDEFVTLLAPNAVVAGENPRCSGKEVVAEPANQGGVSVC
jgi:hypothetical protein